MYQVNVIYNKEIRCIVFDCISIDEASNVRQEKIDAWFAKKMLEGVPPSEIYDLLEIEIVEQEG